MKIRKAKPECGCRAPKGRVPTLQTQQRYVQEKEKQPTQQRQPTKKEDDEGKGAGKVKKFFMKLLNFPEEEIQRASARLNLPAKKLAAIRRAGYFMYRGYRYELERHGEVRAEIDASLIVDWSKDVPADLEKVFNLPPTETVFVHLDPDDFPLETAEALVLATLSHVLAEGQEPQTAPLQRAADYIETELRWNLDPEASDPEAYELLQVPEGGVAVELDTITFPLATIEDLNDQLLAQRGFNPEG